MGKRCVYVCVGRYFLPPRSPPFGLKMIDAPHFPETGQGGRGKLFSHAPAVPAPASLPSPHTAKDGKRQKRKMCPSCFFFGGGGRGERVVALDLRLLCHDVTSFALPS